MNDIPEDDEEVSYRNIDFTDPKYNTEFVRREEMVKPTACRNCSEVKSLEGTRRVNQGFRYCLQCYDKMVSIGQIIPEFRYDTGGMILMWEGDPFFRKKDDPTSEMFGKGFKLK